MSDRTQTRTAVIALVAELRNNRSLWVDDFCPQDQLVTALKSVFDACPSDEDLAAFLATFTGIWFTRKRDSSGPLTPAQLSTLVYDDDITNPPPPTPPDWVAEVLAQENEKK